MNVVRLLPVFLSAVLLAAHLLRTGLGVFAVVGLAFPAVLVFPHRWAVRLVQGVLVLAAAEWVRTLLARVAERQAAGQPYTRLAVILAAVAAFTAASALVFLFRPLQVRYKLAKPSTPKEAAP